MYRLRIGWASLVLVLLLTGSATAQRTGPLSTDLDPASLALRHVPLPLLENQPEALIRRDIKHIEVHEVGALSKHVRRAVTIFSRQGREAFGTIHLPHDAFRDIEALSGYVVDAEGQVVSELEEEDIHDYPANDGFSLYNDLRIRRAALRHDAYPYTLVFEYTIRRNGYLDWPTWYPHHASAPVERATYIVDTPAAMDLRYDARRGAPAPTLQRDNDRRTHTWTLQHALAWEPEPHGPPWHAQAPAVHVVPRQFAIGDTRGTFETWQAFGDWYHALTRDRQALSADAEAAARAAVASARTRRDSVQALYEHMQSHTRYVSVQLGLGGWQPYAAAYVERTGYGDCKALSNYMSALLDVVGIPSSPVLIRSGRHAPLLREAFPENRFNHMILAVPAAQDTLWLETTSQLLPFNHVHRNIAGRKALLVRPDSSHLVALPASSARDNQRIRRASIDVSASGDATASLTTTYTGVLHDGPRHRLAHASDRARRAWMRAQLPFPTFEITDADFSGTNPPEPSIAIPVSVSLPRHAARTASRLFLDIGLGDALPSVPAAPETARTQPVHPFTPPGVYADSVTYALPSGYAVEALPEDTHVELPFATYDVSVQHDAEAQALTYHRRFTLTASVLAPNQFAAYRALLQTMRRTAQSQAVLVRQ